MKKQTTAYAAALYEAQISKQAIPAFSSLNPDFTVDQAYEVQMINVAKQLAGGDIISGKKIGLTSLAMQKLLNVAEPDFGHLFQSMDCFDGKIDSSKLLQPKIEAEIAFILKADLSGGAVTVTDVLKATDYLVAAFEVVDSRIADWKIKLPDTIADNASSGCYVLGTKRIAPKTLDLATVTLSLYKTKAGKEELINQGSGYDVLGHPAVAVAWLANKLWHYGVSLQAGEVILSGALSAAPPAQRGDSFKAVFSDFGILEASFI